MKDSSNGMEDSGLVVAQLGPFRCLVQNEFLPRKKNEMNEFEWPPVKRHHFKKDLFKVFKSSKHYKFQA